MNLQSLGVLHWKDKEAWQSDEPERKSFVWHMFKLTLFCYLQQTSPQQAHFSHNYWMFNFSAARRTWGCLQSPWKTSTHLRKVKLLFIKTLTWAMDMSTVSPSRNRRNRVKQDSYKLKAQLQWSSISVFMGIPDLHTLVWQPVKAASPTQAHRDML